MKEKEGKINISFKSFFKYISTVVSWTIFVLLIILGVLLVYYYVFVKLYAVKGEAYEPKFSIYNVATGSMEPTINVDDVVVNVKVDSIDDVKINDVITFISAWQLNYGMTMTHRVVGVQTLDDGSKCLVTRGDNVTQEDAVCVSEENLIGVVKAVIPGLGKVQRFLSSTLGWLLIIIIPALYIIVKDIIKIVNVVIEDKKGNKKKQNINGNSNQGNNNLNIIKQKDDIKKDYHEYDDLKDEYDKKDYHKHDDKKNEYEKEDYHKYDDVKDKYDDIKSELEDDGLSDDERLEKAFQDLENVRIK